MKHTTTGTRQLARHDSPVTGITSSGFTRRRLLQAGIGVGLAGGTLSVAGFGGRGRGRAAAAETPRAGGKLSISLYGDVDTFDPILATDNRSIWTMNLIYDRLLRPAVDGMSLEPGLATNWETSPDGLTYTFHLREATFQDGSPVTAADVAFSLDRVMNAPESQSTALYPPGTTFSTPDARTVVAHLTTTWGPFLPAVAYYAASVIPRQAYEEQKTLFFDRPIGSGPFQVASWDKGERIGLHKHAAYWEAGKPYLDEVTIVILPDEQARAQQFGDGALDVFTGVPYGQVAAMSVDPAVTMLVEPFAAVSYLALNVMRPPLDDRAVRQALSYAIDRVELVEAVTFGAADPGTTYLPKALTGHDATAAGDTYDPERARTLLAQSAAKDGLKLEFLAVQDDSFWGRAATLVADQLARIGVEVVFPEPANWGDRIQSGRYDLLINQWSAAEGDPDEATTYLMRGDLGSNGSHYANAEFDRLAGEAQTIADPAARQEAHRQLQVIVAEDAPLIFLCYPRALTATTTAVRDFHVLPDGSYRLWDTWRAEG